MKPSIIAAVAATALSAIACSALDAAAPGAPAADTSSDGSNALPSLRSPLSSYMGSPNIERTAEGLLDLFPSLLSAGANALTDTAKTFIYASATAADALGVPASPDETSLMAARIITPLVGPFNDLILTPLFAPVNALRRSVGLGIGDFGSDEDGGWFEEENAEFLEVSAEPPVPPKGILRNSFNSHEGPILLRLFSVPAHSSGVHPSAHPLPNSPYESQSSLRRLQEAAPSSDALSRKSGNLRSLLYTKDADTRDQFHALYRTKEANGEPVRVIQKELDPLIFKSHATTDSVRKSMGDSNLPSYGPAVFRQEFEPATKVRYPDIFQPGDNMDAVDFLDNFVNEVPATQPYNTDPTLFFSENREQYSNTGPDTWPRAKSHQVLPQAIGRRTYINRDPVNSRPRDLITASEKVIMASNGERIKLLEPLQLEAGEVVMDYEVLPLARNTRKASATRTSPGTREVTRSEMREIARFGKKTQEFVPDIMDTTYVRPYLREDFDHYPYTYAVNDPARFLGSTLNPLSFNPAPFPFYYWPPYDTYTRGPDLFPEPSKGVLNSGSTALSEALTLREGVTPQTSFLPIMAAAPVASPAVPLVAATPITPSIAAHHVEETSNILPAWNSPSYLLPPLQTALGNLRESIPDVETSVSSVQENNNGTTVTTVSLLPDNVANDGITPENAIRLRMETSVRKHYRVMQPKNATSKNATSESLSKNVLPGSTLVFDNNSDSFLMAHNEGDAAAAISDTGPLPVAFGVAESPFFLTHKLESNQPFRPTYLIS